MDIQKLFEIQAGLDFHINKEHPIKDGEDRLAKKILALQVELGECANEWRGFKFWSKDQEPRNRCMKCQLTEIPHECENPLLEEYVDCLHFILSIGNEIKCDTSQCIKAINLHTDWILERKDVENISITEQFNMVFNAISEFEQMRSLDEYWSMAAEFLILGAKLEFTDNQVEEAYMEKNKINHERQNSGVY